MRPYLPAINANVTDSQARCVRQSKALLVCCLQIALANPGLVASPPGLGFSVELLKLLGSAAVCCLYVRLGWHLCIHYVLRSI